LGWKRSRLFKNLLKVILFWDPVQMHSLYLTKRVRLLKTWEPKLCLSCLGENCTDSLESLRYSTFTQKMVAAKYFVTSERLHPTASSTKFSLSPSLLPDHCVAWEGK
jgi:hypothetical protein